MCVPSPHIVSRNSENVETESHTIYKGAPQQFSCNPSWTSISGFDPSPFVGQSQVTGPFPFTDA